MKITSCTINIEVLVLFDYALATNTTIYYSVLDK